MQAYQPRTNILEKFYITKGRCAQAFRQERLPRGFRVFGVNRGPYGHRTKAGAGKPSVGLVRKAGGVPIRQWLIRYIGARCYLRNANIESREGNNARQTTSPVPHGDSWDYPASCLHVPEASNCGGKHFRSRGTGRSSPNRSRRLQPIGCELSWKSSHGQLLGDLVRAV